MAAVKQYIIFHNGNSWQKTTSCQNDALMHDFEYAVNWRNDIDGQWAVRTQESRTFNNKFEYFALNEKLMETNWKQSDQFECDQILFDQIRK